MESRSDQTWRIAKTSYGPFNPPLRENAGDRDSWGRFDSIGGRTIYSATTRECAFAEILSYYKRRLGASDALVRDAAALQLSVADMLLRSSPVKYVREPPSQRERSTVRSSKVRSGDSSITSRTPRIAWVNVCTTRRPSICCFRPSGRMRPRSTRVRVRAFATREGLAGNPAQGRPCPGSAQPPLYASMPRVG